MKANIYLTFGLQCKIHYKIDDIQIPGFTDHSGNLFCSEEDSQDRLNFHHHFL